MSPIIETRVDRLQPGDVVTGTTASGEFDNGPRLVESRTKAAREHSVRMTAWVIAWVDAGANIYYGDTQVLVARRSAVSA